MGSYADSVTDFYKDVFDPGGLFHKGGAFRGHLGPINPVPGAVPPLRPPKLDVNTELAAKAAKHEEDIAAVAFGVQDTILTAPGGLGSVPKSLLLPKSSFGGY